MHHRLPCALLLASLSLSAQSRETAAALRADLPVDLLERAEALRDSALAGSPAWDILRSLTMEVGPRLAGSPGDAAAVAWAVDTLQSLGFENVRTEEVEVPHWDRGTLEVAYVEPLPQRMIATSLGGSVGTGEEGITAPVVRAVGLDGLGELEPEAAAGRIVFIDHAMTRSRDGAGYGETVPIRLFGPREAGKLGAAAVLIRSVGTSTARVAHTGATIYDLSAPRIPAIAISNADADRLAYLLEDGDAVTLHIHSSARQLPPTTSANVIGEVPGGAAADEIVLLGAHLDSWDLGTGAIDDGAGVAIVIAAAKMIADLPDRPRRTIRVVLFANEEFGLSGARAYRAARDEELARHVVGIEADFGAGRVWELASNVPPEALDLVAAIAEVLAPIGVAQGGNEASGGADLRPMKAGGMPVLALTQDGTYYFDYHHTVSDTLDKIEIAALDQNVAAHAAAALIAASIERDFGRLETQPVESR